MLKPILDAVPDKLHNLALGTQIAGLREPDEIDTDDIPEMPVCETCCGNEDVQFCPMRAQDCVDLRNVSILNRYLSAAGNPSPLEASFQSAGHSVPVDAAHLISYTSPYEAMAAGCVFEYPGAAERFRLLF